MEKVTVPAALIAEMDSIASMNPISDVVREDGIKLSEKDGILFGNCPFCGEKSAFIIKNGMFLCMNCGKSGNSVSYFLFKGKKLQEAVDVLSKRLGASSPSVVLQESKQAAERLWQLNKEAARFYYLCGNKAEIFQKYLEKRKISQESRAAFKLGWADDSNRVVSHLKSKGFSEEEIISAGVLVENEGRKYCRFFNRLVMPILDSAGNFIGFGGRRISDEPLEGGRAMAKYINTAQTPVFTKGRELFGYNIVKANRDTKPLVLVEGNFDVISLHQAGVKTAVASLGTALTIEQAKKIRRYKKNVFVAYDNDEAGQRATAKAILTLKRAGCIAAVVSSAPYKDFDEAVQHETKEELRNRFASYVRGEEWLKSYAKKSKDFELLADLLSE